MEIVQILPVDEDGHGDKRHEDDHRQGATAVEDVVGEPAADDGAGDGCHLIGKVGPAGILDVDTLLGEDGRSPVQTTVAHHIDKGIGKGYVPEEAVGQHGVEDLL